LFSYLSKGENTLDAFDRTLYKGIKQLLPAQALTLNLSREELRLSEVWTYWQIDRNARLPYGSQKMESASEHFFELLKSSVALRLRSDVPVGSSLSGGLDSSSIVSLIRYLEPERALNTFTGRFPGAPTDEGYYADIVQKAKKTIHHEVFPTSKKFIAEASGFYWHAEFPVGGLSQFAQWCVFEKASNEGVKVLLDGQGSDEQLGGYGGAIQQAYLNQLFNGKRYAPLFYEYRCAAKVNPKRFSLLRVLLNDTPLAHLRPALRQIAGRSNLEFLDLTNDDFQKLPRLELPFSEMPDQERMGCLSDFLWELSFRTMLSSLLRYGDRLSMAFGLEVRLPFCDHRLSEFVFTLPPELLVGESIVKRVLRDGMKKILPEEVRTREKQGFIPPQEKWLTEELLPWAVELDIQDKGPLDEILDRKKTSKFFKENPEKDPNFMWRLLNLRAWSHFFAQRAQTQLKHSAVAVQLDGAIKASAL
jgi:asparagine synthase (glutamine-hydrolysing)